LTSKTVQSKPRETAVLTEERLKEMHRLYEICGASERLIHLEAKSEYLEGNEPIELAGLQRLRQEKKESMKSEPTIDIVSEFRSYAYLDD